MPKNNVVSSRAQAPHDDNHTSSGIQSDDKKRGASSKVQSEEKKRVTFLLPPGLDNLLELYCNQRGLQKNEIAAKALAEFLALDIPGLKEAVRAHDDAIEHLVSTASRHKR